MFVLYIKVPGFFVVLGRNSGHYLHSIFPEAEVSKVSFLKFKTVKVFALVKSSGLQGRNLAVGTCSVEESWF